MSITAHSTDNQAVVPDSGLVISGFCEDRTLNIYPITNVMGLANITVTVTDLLGNSSSIVFNIEVLNNQPVSFPDPALQTAVQVNANIPNNLTLYDLRGLMALCASQSGITNLAGIQSAHQSSICRPLLQQDHQRHAPGRSHQPQRPRARRQQNRLPRFRQQPSPGSRRCPSRTCNGIRSIAPLANKTNLRISRTSPTTSSPTFPSSPISTISLRFISTTTGCRTSPT